MGTRKIHKSSKSGKTWVVDTRAEVGLLSRNIKIQGDTYSETSKTGFGGHIMAMNNSTANASNVELFRMGQKAKLGRYPWHWHLMGDSSRGLSLRNSSIHRSYNRAIVIHGSHGTIVDNNVAYDHIGHGIMLEDGSERFNTISNNLALMTRRPKSGEELTKSDIEPADKDQNSAPSTYWITNPNNTFVRNVAAGTIGTGFWFAFPKKPTGASATDPRFQNIEPFKENLRRFDGNIVHSSRNGFDVNDQLDAQHAIVKNRPWKNSKQARINNMTIFSCKMAFYSGIGDDNENLILNNCVSSDNVLHLRFASNTIIQNSIFVANTGLLSNSIKKDFYMVYDGPGRVYDSHMVGWNKGNVSLFKNAGAAQKRGNHMFKGISFNHSGFPKVGTTEALPKCSQGRSGQVWGAILYDIDGSLTGKSNSSIIPDLAFNKTSRTYKVPNWNGMMRSTQKYVYVRFGHNPKFEITRFHNGVKQASFNYKKAEIGGVNQTHVPVDHNMYEHQVVFPNFPSNKRNLPISIGDAIRAGDAVTLRLKGWSKLPGVSISNAIKVNSLPQLRAQKQSSYFLRNNGDLYLRIITKANNTLLSQNLYNVSWKNRAGISHSINSNDCNGKISQQPDITEGTKFNFKIHPNPANSLTTVSIEGNYNHATVSIYDILGKKATSSLKVNSKQSSVDIDISNLSIGFYWISVHTNLGEQKNIRLIKQ